MREVAPTKTAAVEASADVTASNTVSCGHSGDHWCEAPMERLVGDGPEGVRRRARPVRRCGRRASRVPYGCSGKADAPTPARCGRIQSLGARLGLYRDDADWPIDLTGQPSTRLGVDHPPAAHRPSPGCERDGTVQPPGHSRAERVTHSLPVGWWEGGYVPWCRSLPR